MRLRTLILVCTAVVFSACSLNLSDEHVTEESGTLSIELQPEIVVQTKSGTNLGGPDKNEFKIEIYKHTSAGLLRLYRDTYANTVGQKIRLNAADYTVHARFGDSLGVGFNSIYYAAEAVLPVRPQTDETVTLEARMACAKVAVEYGSNLVYDWPEYYVRVKSTTKGGRTRNLIFSQTETRVGYMPAGSFVVELYLKIDGEWKYYHAPAMEVAPNDFITFNVDTERASSDVTLSARVDDGLNTIERKITMSSEWLPKDAPTINTLGLDGEDFTGKTYAIIEASNMGRSDLKADIVAPGRVEHCYLEVTSEYLASLGVPEVVDLASEIGPAVEAALESVGLRWMKGMYGQRLSYVDFSGVSKWLDEQVYDPDNLFSATFSVSVSDHRNADAEAQTNAITFTQGVPVFSFSDIKDYDCWAKQIKNIKTQITSGNPDALVLEYKKSTEGESAWTALAPTSTDSETGDMVYNLLGASPSTVYDFRLSYNGNPVTRISQTATTEAASQVGNNGFEEHTYEAFKFKYNKYLVGGATTEYRTWYQPYKSGETDPWWAVNSTATLDASVTTQYLTYKTFPTVCMTRSDVYAGSRAIIVASIATTDYGSDLMSGDAISGELYIGKADNSGEHKNTHISDGHAFPSRPLSMSFHYKFDYHDSPFKADIILYNGATQIATGSFTSGSEDVSAWTKADVALTYTDSTKKADKIYIWFVSSSTNSTGSRKTTLSILDTDGSAKTTDNIHAGNIIWLDNVILNYE